MAQLKADQLMSVFGNLALTGPGVVGIRKQARRSSSLRRIFHKWEIPDPFTRRAETIIHRAVWTYAGLTVATTIIYNIVR